VRIVFYIFFWHVLWAATGRSRHALLAMVYAGVEVANRTVEEKLEIEMWHGGNPLLESSLFAEAADMWPVIEH
jgi:hypothetical protein